MMNKVSCITVTKNRLPLLKKSIEHFLNQTHTDKEMIIAYYNTDKETSEWLQSNKDNLEGRNIFTYMFIDDVGLYLGAIRNFAISKATGDWLCIWDDDDYYAPIRIQEQLKFCIDNNLNACTLKSILVFSNKHQSIKETFERIEGWEGSLFVKKTSMYKYKNISRGEDTPVIVDLIQSGNLKSFYNPDLYIYIFHDKNTSSSRHKETLLEHSFNLDISKIRELKEILEWI